MAVVYKINGREVSPKKFRKHKPRGANGLPAAHVGLRPSKMLVSDGAAVHPDDAKEAEQVATKLGVPTHFRPDGRPEFTSFSHQRRYLRTQGMHNRHDPLA